jgi:hypothetical protein
MADGMQSEEGKPQKLKKNTLRETVICPALTTKNVLADPGHRVSHGRLDKPFATNRRLHDHV